ncbi:hypothetical protein ANOM_000749 [Aspergillus nomiae NRRL 13137]|uniref:Fibronectin type III-like domain-containing protein n=1 Tax=Aspergillus nomiae NRRL (strain ATCC 15546 / NRRL 13137 / CBS 260.88 / M93) TaxID=1509407 RepID=A0A0L1JH52_ASPN3|nr:uncharacterized protein ANOM_000749 [Aspergillus nomiae NRRL 13137]KNG91094.1 hypothetical protein ANOM_000749 [Aspergillus nomiae NRRL 13137]
MSSCLKCRSTGRICDGYEDIVNDELHVYALSQGPSTWDFLSQDGGENENFFFFRSVTTFTLAGSFDTDFWSHRLLQVSHHYPALRHGMAALACIHREYATDSTPSTQSRIGESRNMEFALRQTNKSIQALLKLLSEPVLSNQDKMVVLATCILYTCMCSLQGRQYQAFMHINNGLKLFHQWGVGEKLNSQPAAWKGADMLLLAFIRFDSQVRPYLVGQTASLSWNNNQIAPSPSTAPFTGLLEAYVSLEALFNRIMRFFLGQDTKDPCVQSRAAEKQMYIQLLHDWDTRLALLLSTTSKSEDGRALDVLSTRRKFAKVLLCTDPTQSELAPDALLNDCVDMIEAISRILDDSNQQALRQYQHAEQATSANFSLDTGIVEPLFWRYPRREGICEGMIASKIVAKVIEIEESGCPQALADMGATSPCTQGQWICEIHRVASWEFILVTERLPGGHPDLYDVLATVQFKVTNTGELAGATVPQLYLAFPHDTTPAGTPVKVLQAFEKVHLKAGRSQTVKFEITHKDMSFWNVVRQEWEIHSGSFEAMVGFSSRKISATKAFEVF